MATSSEARARAESRLALYYAHEEAILKTGSSYTREGLTLTRANLTEVQDQIKYLQREVSRMTNSTGRMIFSDFSGVEAPYQGRFE